MDIETNIKAILEAYFAGFKDEIIDCATKRINESIQGDSKSKWIPIDKAQPRCLNTVLVTVKDTSGDSPFYYTTTAWKVASVGNLWVSDNDIVTGEVIAWMSFPEIYEEGKVNE